MGTPAEGGDVRFRRAACAVIAGPHGSAAAVQTRLGLFLPGGSAEPGETPEDALRRERLEEIGRREPAPDSLPRSQLMVDG